jgi:hypothetical protein
VSSPPSDTIKLRLPETNLLVEDVEWGSTGHSYFQVIREDADPLDQLLPEASSFTMTRATLTICEPAPAPAATG